MHFFQQAGLLELLYIFCFFLVRLVCPILPFPCFRSPPEVVDLVLPRAPGAPAAPAACGGAEGAAAGGGGREAGSLPGSIGAGGPFGRGLQRG